MVAKDTAALAAVRPGLVGKIRSYLPDLEERYITQQITDSDPATKKFGLQLLCKRLRGGVGPRRQPAMRQVVLGAIYSQDPKVRRWVLNSLALIGTADDVEAIIEAIGRDVSDPDILSAGIAALFSIERATTVERLMEKKGIGLEGAALLAGAQASPDLAERVRLNRVNVETATDAELRLALVLVGLNKAPPNTFSIKHENGEIVGALNKHHEKTVAQYSVWAINENSSFSLKDLQIPLTDIEGLAENVRGWIFRLLSEKESTAKDHIDYLHLGSHDKSEDARRGLSTGLSQIYFDGLEEITMEWLPREENTSISDRLLEHMSRAVDKCEIYQEPVLYAYRNAGANSLLRARLSSAAHKTSFYRNLKLVDLEAEGSDLLFDLEEKMGPKQMINQTFNAPVGNVTGSGDIHINTLQMLASSQIDQNLRPALAELTNILGSGRIDAAEAEKGHVLVQEAVKNQNKLSLTNLVDWLRKTKDGSSHAADTAASLGKVAEAIGSIADAF